MGIKTLGLKLTKCPKCHGELIDMTYQDDEREKECPVCDLQFKKKKGRWHRWKMGTVEEFIEDEIKHF